MHQEQIIYPQQFVGDFFYLFFYVRTLYVRFFIVIKSNGGIFRNEFTTDKKSR